MILVAVLTLLAQVPALNKWIDEATSAYPHLITLAEGIIGLVLLIIATTKGDRHETHTPEPQSGGKK
jgi:hypothetical protein